MDDNKETLNKHTLKRKILTVINHAIDYNSAGSNVDLKIQKENIKEILYQILSDPELIKVFDSTNSKFWDEVMEKGVLVYYDACYMRGDQQQKLVITSQQFACPQIFTTITGRKVCIGSAYEKREEKIPAVVLQKKKKILRYY